MMRLAAFGRAKRLGAFAGHPEHLAAARTFAVWGMGAFPTRSLAGIPAMNAQVGLGFRGRGCGTGGGARAEPFVRARVL
jgi:hypothetical protein